MPVISNPPLLLVATLPLELLPSPQLIVAVKSRHFEPAL
jgi:hypothetical protein